VKRAYAADRHGDGATDETRELAGSRCPLPRIKEVQMDSQTLEHGAVNGRRTALDALSVVGGALVVYIAVGILIETFTSRDVPFVTW
jgi:hypothetical protein